MACGGRGRDGKTRPLHPCNSIAYADGKEKGGGGGTGMTKRLQVVGCHVAAEQLVTLPGCNFDIDIDNRGIGGMHDGDTDCQHQALCPC